MKAWHIYAAGLGFYVLGRWARNNKAVPSAKQVGGAIFVLFALDLADTGNAAPVARGFAWLFTTAAVLTSIGPVTKNIGGTGSTSQNTTVSGGGGADANF